jgi:osmotically inducible protein OsmC
VVVVPTPFLSRSRILVVTVGEQAAFADNVVEYSNGHGDVLRLVARLAGAYCLPAAAAGAIANSITLGRYPNQGGAMATERSSRCVWEGSLTEGKGNVSLESSGAIRDLEVTWASRTEDPQGRTSPEELIAAAHAACFSMQLSGGLAKVGNPPERLEVGARVGFQAGVGITGIHLDVTGTVPGVSKEDFTAAAEHAKENCPVSQALGVDITLSSELMG